MILKQYYLGYLAHMSYLVADEESQAAAIIDPQRDVEQYLTDAQRFGLTIRHVFLTHFHADFVAGHLELQERCRARIYLGSQAQAEYEFTPAYDGWELPLGKVRLRILETPGHSPESVSILVYDLKKSDSDPHAVLTGDTLFIGDVGRPDLRASLGWSATELAGKLYDSLHQKLLKLPDDTVVYPAHGAGSLCGKNLSSERLSTIGDQRWSNYALQPMTREDFIRLVTSDQPDAPGYFTYDAMLNAREHPTLDKTLRVLRPLPFEEVLRLTNAGAQLVDARAPAAFAAAHLGGSVNIPLDGAFETWAGTLLDWEKSIIIVAKPRREAEVAIRLGRIGFDRVAGYLSGGGQDLATRPGLIRRLQRLTAADLMAELTSSKPPLVLDVRAESEWRQKAIDGALNVPLNHLRERLHEVPHDRKIVIHCATGYRSSIAASLLERQGLEDVADLVGGITAWEAQRFPLQGSTIGARML